MERLYFIIIFLPHTQSRLGLGFFSLNNDDGLCPEFFVPGVNEFPCLVFLALIEGCGALLEGNLLFSNHFFHFGHDGLLCIDLPIIYAVNYTSIALHIGLQGVEGVCLLFVECGGFSGILLLEFVVSV